MKNANNYSTPLQHILFNCSKIGLLAAGLQKNDLTENQREEMKRLQKIKTQPEGLTATQQKKLDGYNEKVKEGKPLTPKQTEEKADFEKKLITPKGLTENQSELLKQLEAKENAEPTLSQGAKTYVKEVWLKLEKGFKEDFSSKETRKGLQGEEDAINLVCFVDGIQYNKNSERITKKNLTGECDINTTFKESPEFGLDKPVKIIDDTKASWNPRTFMNADLVSLYEWQLRGYLHLYNADIARLRYCLVDCPPDVYADELKKFCWNNNIIDSTIEEYQPLIKQFHNNYFYSDTGYYSKEERVKTFAISRDLEKEAVLLKSIELAVEYYKTITLNMIE